MHTASARGHLRANIEKERRVCFEIDEQEGVFDYGRFECDSGLAYRSVCLFGQIRIVENRDIKQRFCEALMAKYGLNAVALYVVGMSVITMVSVIAATETMRSHIDAA